MGSILSILGPVMVGPSSSHTAGIARLGKITREILGEKPQKARITFYGSLASTYQGHGSDRAVIGGLLGFISSDIRLRDSFSLAQKEGLSFTITGEDRSGGHPNTVKFIVSSAQQEVEVLGSSRGGGAILVERINGFPVTIAGLYPTLWILHYDRPGVVGQVASCLADDGLNIASINLERSHPGGLSSLTIQMDSPVSQPLLQRIQENTLIYSCRYIAVVR